MHRKLSKKLCHRCVTFGIQQWRKVGHHHQRLFRMHSNSCFHRHSQAHQFPMKNFFIVFRQGRLPHRQKPTPGAANHSLLRLDGIVLNRIHVFRQMSTHLADCVPPVIMIALQQHFLPGELSDQLQIRNSGSKLHGPGNISRDQYRVFLAHSAPPILADPFEMMLPLGTKDVHGFLFAAGQMQITNGKQPHACFLSKRRSILKPY